MITVLDSRSSAAKLAFQRRYYQTYVVPKRFWMLELRWLQGQVVFGEGASRQECVLYVLLTGPPLGYRCMGVEYVHTEPRAHSQVLSTLLLESLRGLELTE